MIGVLREAIMITGFVFVMMLVIEYLNVITSGVWRSRITQSRWGQYLLASALGAVPGCLGAFAVVAMYSHRLLSLGAVVAAMIATSGDESFVFLAMAPARATLFFAVLFLIGIAAGALVDGLLGRRFTRESICPNGLEIHEEFLCDCFDRRTIGEQWRDLIAVRGILTVVLGVIIVFIAAGQVGPEEWNWMRVTLLVATALALFIVVTVPDHFLEEHLWRHIALKHVPRIFLWTLGALLVMYILVNFIQVDIEESVEKSRWVVLLVASLVGIIPESGPHMIFVTLYVKGVLPPSILLASSIVQDGHGMLPLLAHSGRAFVVIKMINFVIGLAVGAIVMMLGH